MRPLIICAVIGAILAGAPAQAAPVVIRESLESEKLGPHLEILEDRTRALSLEDVSSAAAAKRFRRSTEENPNFGFTRSSVWARFTLDNATRAAAPLYLEFSQPWVDRVDLFIPEGPRFKSVEMGDGLPFNARIVRDRNIIFPLVLKPGAVTCYMRFHTTSTLSLDLVVWSPGALGLRKGVELPAMWAYYGVLAAMILYNFFLFFSVRKTSYLVYVFFVASLLLYLLSYSGVAYQYLWPNDPAWASRAMSVFIQLTAIGFCQFARSYLDVRALSRILDRVLLVYMLVCVVQLFVTALLPPGESDRYVAYTAILGVPPAIATSILALAKRQRYGRIYFIAWCAFFAGTLVNVLRGIGVLPQHLITHYAMHLGSAVQIMLFSFGMSDRIERLTDEKMRALEALNESEEKYRTLIENAAEAIFVTQDFKIKFLNSSTLRGSAYAEEELTTRDFWEFIHPDDRGMMLDRYRARISGGEVSTLHEFRVVERDGRIRWMEISAVLIRWEGRPAVLNFLVDITDRKHAEERLRESLREKDLLLKEMHHRVKNNMQIVSSLLNMQSRHLKSADELGIFMDSQNRIRSMSMIHELLYQSGDFVRVNFAEYVENLARALLRSYHVNPQRIKLDIRAENVSIGVDAAIPCGLIVNELLSNCMKYAFPGEREGEIRIILQEDGERGMNRLVVQDNGVGMKPGQDLDNPETMGLHLVRMLVEQMNGTISLESAQGTSFLISFPPAS